MSQAKIDILQRALEREKAARKSAEEIIQDTIKEFNETCSKLGALKL